jgi:outer membrane murein-binding lipoprotein Lpp
MTYTEDPGYEPALHRDLEPIEQRINELDTEVRHLGAEVRTLTDRVDALERGLRNIADQHV